MAKLFDHTTKKYVDVNDDQVDDLMSTNNYTFQTDIDVPTISPDGVLGSIPSANAQLAWQQGYRWPTSADKTADFNRKNAAIKQANDTPLSTFGMSTLNSATMGAVDAGLAAGEGLGVPGLGGFVDARNLGKETSPIADVAGNVTGAVASMALSGGSSILGAAGRGSNAVVKAADAALAAKGVGTVGRAVGKGAAEGAYWSAGQAVSDAALGKPEDIVTNLVSGITLGTVMGGGFGAAIGGGKLAAPFLQKSLDAGVELGQRTTKGLARQIVSKVSAPVMKLKGQGQEADDLVALSADEAFLSAWSGGGDDVAKLTNKALSADQTILKKEARGLAKEIKNSLKTATKAEKTYIDESVAALNGNMQQVLSKSYDDLVSIGTAFDDHIAVLNGPPRFGKDYIKTLTDQADNIAPYGSEAKSLATEIKAITKAYSAGSTEGRELQMMREIKALVNQGARKNLKGEAHDQARKLWSRVDNDLKNHANPEVSVYNNTYDTIYGAHSNLKKLFGSTKKKGGGIENFINNAAVKTKMAPMFNNLKEFAPELIAIRNAGSSVAKQQAAFNQLNNKYQTIAKDTISPDNMAEFKEVVLDIIKDPKILNGTKRLEDIQAAMSGIENLNGIDAAIRLKTALGQDITGLSKLSVFGDKWEKLQRLSKIDKASQGRGIGLGEAALTYATGGLATLPIAVNRLASVPAGSLKALAFINKQADRGADLLKRSLVKAGTAITSRPIGVVTARFAQDNQSREYQANKYNKVKESVAQMANPEAMAAAIEKIGGDTSNMPDLKLAIGLRLQTATAFLASSIPTDPLAAFSVTPHKSRWTPSDAEMSRFLRKVDAVNNPTAVIDRLADGVVTRDEVEAIKIVHPDIYNQLQSSLVNAIMEKGDEIPYARRVQLNVLFQIPTDYSMQPEFITQMQAPYQAQDQGGRPTNGAPRTKNIDVSPFDTVQTETSRITYNKGS